jgi:hypothetical protein
MTITREELHNSFIKASAERKEESFKRIYDEIYNSVMKANLEGRTLYESNYQYTGNPEIMGNVANKLQKVFIDSSIRVHVDKGAEAIIINWHLPQRNKLLGMYMNRMRLLAIEFMTLLNKIVKAVCWSVPTEA